MQNDQFAERGRKGTKELDEKKIIKAASSSENLPKRRLVRRSAASKAKHVYR